MRIYIIAGEASGDLHGSHLALALKSKRPDISLRGWGGDLMKSAGVHLSKHYRELAFMGFVEVLLNIRTIIRNFKIVQADILDYKPDALLLIDYPGFNLRMAKWAKKKGIPVYYYISPTVWAWKENRVEVIRKYVRRLFVILPFEKDFYAQRGIEVSYVGHPLLDAIQHLPEPKAEIAEVCRPSNKECIVLLPGSRKQEIKAMLPVMLKMKSRFPDFEFVIAGAPGMDASYYEQFTQFNPTPVIFGATYDLLRIARAGLVTSGTATLEAGLFKLPQVVCYVANPISFFIAKRLVTIRYISLINLILSREAVAELIQNDFHEERLFQELNALLHNEERIQKMNSDYQELHGIIGGPGAADKISTELLKTIELG
ncbi:MAG: lipid-A-disaccharide synthase [Flavobacteriales bacterium]